MVDDPLDNLDRRILHLLQIDAQGASGTDIVEETDVTGTTIHNRIKELEEGGVILGYNPEISYEQAGYPVRVLIICSTDLSSRSDMAEQVLDVPRVVNVREMLDGEDNLHVEIVAETTSDVEQSIERLDERGMEIVGCDMLVEEHIQRKNHFSTEIADDPETLP